MTARLFVDNLPEGVGEEALRALFAQAGRGVLSVSIVSDRDTGQPRGFGFVEMATPADAQAVIAEWNGQQLDGRTLKVNEAQERQGGGGGGRGGGGGGGGGGRGWGRGGY